MEKSQIGVYGLGVMGQNLAYNIASKGYKVSVYNRSHEKIIKTMEGAAKYGNMQPAYSLQEFAESLEKPRKIVLMLTAGSVIDTAISGILPYLEADDILIDCGNTFYKDTQRRQAYLKESGVNFIGAGISGGEEGALNGPSIMPSGDKNAYKQVEKILVDISAKTGDGSPCCRYIGPDGSGHFVKMVHNGIEYADMQLICDVYQLMRQAAGFSVEKIQAIFEGWNKGRLNSYLIEITAEILKVSDPETGKPLIDVILDKAGHKGTGKWTSLEGIEIGVPIPSIVESVLSRYVSALKDERIKASGIFKWAQQAEIQDEAEFIADLEAALYSAKICCYAQGFQLLNQASKEYGWNLELGEISLIWREGCIIRAEFLNSIKTCYDKDGDIENLMLSDVFSGIINDSQKALRSMVSLAVWSGCSVPGLMSTLLYFDSYRTASSSISLLQAQRDFFGAHTYQRVDKEGSFHTEWLGLQ